MSVPLVDLAAQEALIVDDALAAVARVAREARFVMGETVAAFERWLASTCGATHAVGVASGTDAIELSLRAVGTGRGDAVVTPAFSFVAAAGAISATGARPVFCDVESSSMNASVRTMGEAIDRARRAGLCVRAVVPVHLFGLCTQADELARFARREGLAIIEDAAQAILARDTAGGAAGSAGDTGCFSFFPTKNLGAWGDGGAIVTSSDEIAARLRRLRSHGAVGPYIHEEIGRNSRLDAVQAAVLLAKTRHLGGWRDARARIAARYHRDLAAFPIVLPRAPVPPAVHAWHAFVVRVPCARDALADHLRQNGVETRVYYPLPLHRQRCFAALGEPALPHAEDACRTALALPIFPTMRDDQQGWVIEQIARFFEG